MSRLIISVSDLCMRGLTFFKPTFRKTEAARLNSLVQPPTEGELPAYYSYAPVSITYLINLKSEI